jgi:hypothetical protein
MAYFYKIGVISDSQLTVDSEERMRSSQQAAELEVLAAVVVFALTCSVSRTHSDSSHLTEMFPDDPATKFVFTFPYFLFYHPHAATIISTPHLLHSHYSLRTEPPSPLRYRMLREMRQRRHPQGSLLQLPPELGGARALQRH